eukprot:1136311-Pleurochrysis_carterae.AAC.2
MFEHWLTTDHVWPDNTLRDVISLDSHECLVAVTAYPTFGAVDIDVFDMMQNTSLSQRMSSHFASTAMHAEYFASSVSSLLDPWFLLEFVELSDKYSDARMRIYERLQECGVKCVENAFAISNFDHSDITDSPT